MRIHNSHPAFFLTVIFGSAFPTPPPGKNAGVRRKIWKVIIAFCTAARNMKRMPDLLSRGEKAQRLTTSCLYINICGCLSSPWPHQRYIIRRHIDLGGRGMTSHVYIKTIKIAGKKVMVGWDVTEVVDYICPCYVLRLMLDSSTAKLHLFNNSLRYGDHDLP